MSAPTMTYSQKGVPTGGGGRGAGAGTTYGPDGCASATPCSRALTAPPDRPPRGRTPAADDTTEDVKVTRTASAARQVRRYLRTLTRHPEPAGGAHLTLIA